MAYDGTGQAFAAFGGWRSGVRGQKDADLMARYVRHSIPPSVEVRPVYGGVAVSLPGLWVEVETTLQHTVRTGRRLARIAAREATA